MGAKKTPRTKDSKSKTRGQRRLLKRLAGSEHRAVEWRLWNVANDIVREAIARECGTIAVEDLKGIRGRIKVAQAQAGEVLEDIDKNRAQPIGPRGGYVTLFWHDRLNAVGVNRRRGKVWL